MTHYHYGAGLHGCLYQDGPHTAETYIEAVEALTESYDLGRRRARALRDDAYLGLNLRRDGNEYCEITDCDDDDCRDDEA